MGNMHCSYSLSHEPSTERSEYTLLQLKLYFYNNNDG